MEGWGGGVSGTGWTHKRMIPTLLVSLEGRGRGRVEVKEGIWDGLDIQEDDTYNGGFNGGGEGWGCGSKWERKGDRERREGVEERERERGRRSESLI